MTSESFERRELLLALLALAACGGAGVPTGGATVEGAPGSTFHAIYGDEAQRTRFKGFYDEVFRLYPPDALHALVEQATRTHAIDKEIYSAVVSGLPDISPRARLLRLALPALAKQKKVMAGQVAQVLGAEASIDGYLEIGTTGRYVNAIGKHVKLQGPTFVLNDKKPSKDPADIVERGQVSEVGTWVDMADYAPLAASIPDASVQVVTNFIGFHHAPPDKLAGFIDGIRRVTKPGGTLLLREHDVTDPTMDSVVALAHDVFNAGTDVAWSDNEAELRHFASVEAWKKVLASHGFVHTGVPIAQAGDPTQNMLLAFTKS